MPDDLGQHDSEVQMRLERASNPRKFRPERYNYSQGRIRVCCLKCGEPWADGQVPDAPLHCARCVSYWRGALSLAEGNSGNLSLAEAP